MIQWLESQARQAGFRSLRELARAAVDDPAWPAGASDKPASLAAVLSRINRGSGRAWLEKRPGAGRVLARLLGLPSFERLLAAAGDQAPDVAQRPRLLDGLLDPHRDDLFPGLPPEVLDPGAWRRLWWHAPAGAGRTVVGEWLAARGPVAFVRARTWEEAVAQLPERGPVYVELLDPAGYDALAPGFVHPCRLCIAAPFPPPTADPWDFATAPPCAEWRAHLCAWARERLPDGGRFRVKEALDLLEAKDPVGRIFATPGAVLGVCRLLDRHGAAKLRRLGVQSWVQEAFRDPTLARRLVDTILDARADGWERARPRAEWERLVPADVAQPPDVERARELLERGDAERALDALEPGPAETVQGMVDARMLEPVAPDRFALRPVWAFRLLEDGAVARRLEARRPAEWGALLLQPHLAADVVERLVARFAAGHWEVADRAARGLDRSDPASVAACEGVVRAAGLALLDGARPPAGLRRRLLRVQAGLLFESEAAGPPGPRLDLETDADGPPILRVGAWTLAMLALTEGVERTRTRGLPGSLAPWQLEEADPLLDEALWNVQRTVLEDQTTRWTRAAFELVARLPAPPPTINPLVWPRHVAGAFRSGDVDLLLKLASLWDVPSEALDFVDELMRRRGQAWRHVARLIWLAWRHSEDRFVPELLRHDGPEAPRLWRFLPRAALLYLLHQDLPVAFEHLGPRQWRSVFAERLQVYSPKWPVPWRHAPRKAVQWAARHGLLGNADVDVLRELWAGHPDVLRPVVAAALEEDDLATARPLLSSAPLDETPFVVGIFKAHPTDDPAVRRWLYKRVTRRAPGWQRAYALL